MKLKYLLLAIMLAPTTGTAQQKSGLTEEVCRPFATKRYDDYVKKTKTEGQFKVSAQTTTWEAHRALMIQSRVEKCLREGMWEDEIDEMAARLYAKAQADGKPYQLCGAASCSAVKSENRGLPEAICRSFAIATFDSYANRTGLKRKAAEAFRGTSWEVVRDEAIEERTKNCFEKGMWFNDTPPIR